MKRVKAYLLGDPIPSNATFLMSGIREIKEEGFSYHDRVTVFFYEIPDVVERKKVETTDIKGDIDRIITYLNVRTGKRFSSTAKANIDIIKPRLLVDKYSLNDFKRIIDTKCKEWIGNGDMEKYLRPETLFSKKHFESYLNESPVETESDLFAELESYNKGDSDDS